MKRLSDFQLYSLLLNLDLRHDLRDQVSAEFKVRNFSQEHIDQLALEHERIIPVVNDNLTIWEKVPIMAFPFIIPLQAILANRYISEGNLKKWEQHWKYVTIGLLIWLIILFLVAHFLLKY